jgi:hypothetical protein
MQKLVKCTELHLEDCNSAVRALLKSKCFSVLFHKKIYFRYKSAQKEKNGRNINYVIICYEYIASQTEVLEIKYFILPYIFFPTKRKRVFFRGELVTKYKTRRVENISPCNI